MAKLFTLDATKTYATHANAVKAVEKIYSNRDDLRYIVVTHTDGRFYPVFLGEKAVTAGVHFNFHVVF